MDPRSSGTAPAPPAYAATTKVPVAKTRAEIDMLLERIGATQRGSMVDDEAQRAIVAFVLKGAHYRVNVPLPRFVAPGGHSPRAGDSRAMRDHEQATRSRWRGVLLLLKAKIEAVRLGLSSFEKEFLSDLILPDGRTVQESIPDIIRNGGAHAPQLEEGHHG